jgi:hypothetical protein
LDKGRRGEGRRVEGVKGRRRGGERLDKGRDKRSEKIEL